MPKVPGEISPASFCGDTKDSPALQTACHSVLISVQANAFQPCVSIWFYLLFLKIWPLADLILWIIIFTFSFDCFWCSVDGHLKVQWGKRRDNCSWTATNLKKKRCDLEVSFTNDIVRALKDSVTTLWTQPNTGHSLRQNTISYILAFILRKRRERG